MATPSFNRDFGPGFVYWNDVLVGVTAGGFAVKGTDNFADIKEDGQGEAAVDAVFTGRVFDPIEIPLTRVTLAQLEAMTEGSELTGNVLKFGNVVGVSMYESAQALKIVPAINNLPSTDPTEVLLFHKAFPTIAWEIGYDNENQRIFKVAFKLFPKQESPNLGDYGLAGTEPL